MYCAISRNKGNCERCSLVNYGRDCRNNPVRPTLDWCREVMVDRVASQMMEIGEARRISAGIEPGACDSCGAEPNDCRCGDYVSTTRLTAAQMIAREVVCPVAMTAEAKAKVASWFE